MKNIRVFLSENFQFLAVKFSIYLNRRVFINGSHLQQWLCTMEGGRVQFINSGVKGLTNL